MEEEINFRFLYSLERDKTVVGWLMKRGLLADRYMCPICRHPMKLVKLFQNSDGVGWRCQKYGENSHSVRRSIRKGTWFERSKLSLTEILIMCYMWSLKLSSGSICRDLKISESTVVDWKSFCREICLSMCIEENEKLGGIGKTVEIDEYKFGGVRKSQIIRKGKRPDGSWVIGGIERGTNKCFMAVVQKKSKEALLEIIEQFILPGTTVISNCWSKYNILQDQNYLDLTRVNSIQLKSPENSTDTNCIHGTWSAVKRSLNANKSVTHFDSYLFEYIWRRRHKSENVFETFLESVKKTYPPPTED